MGGQENGQLSLEINAVNETMLRSAIALIESLLVAVRREIAALKSPSSVQTKERVPLPPASTNQSQSSITTIVGSLSRGTAAVPFVYPDSDGVFLGNSGGPVAVTNVSTRIKEALKTAAMRSVEPISDSPISDSNQKVLDESKSRELDQNCGSTSRRKKRSFQEAEDYSTECRRGIGGVQEPRETPTQSDPGPWIPQTIRDGLLMRERK